MDIIANYYNFYKSKNTHESIEFEVRFYLQEKEWYEKYKQLSHGVVSHEQSMTCIKDNKRIEAYFSNGAQTMKKTIIKKRLMDVHYGNYKLALASEKDINEVIKINDTDVIRFRTRKSIVHDMWRYDFTIVDTVRKKKYSDVPNMLAAFKKGELITPTRKYELEAEYIGAENMNVRDIEAIINESPIQRLAALLNKQGKKIKELTNNPRTLLLATYYEKVMPNISAYYLTDKADGVRALVYYDATKITIYTDKSVIEHDNNTDIKDSIFDAEYIEDKDVYFIFDVLRLNGKNIVNQSFTLRWTEIKGLALPLKTMILLSESTYRDAYKELYNRETLYEKDGLIFTPAVDFYYDATIYKWKPPENNTIDFLVKKLPDDEKGKKPYVPNDADIYLLYVMAKPSDLSLLGLRKLPFNKYIFPQQDVGDSHYIPIHFSPSMNQYAYVYVNKDEEHRRITADMVNRIVEFRCSQCKWQPVRIREDRNLPNYFRAAEENFMEYYNPFTFERLFASNASYFRNTKSNDYKALTKYNRVVTWNIFEYLENKSIVYDLACGRGADLTLYYSRYVKQLVACDRDIDALEVLITNRKYNLHNPAYYNFGYDEKHSMSVNVKHIDLTQDYNLSLNKFSEFAKGDAVVINFAIHYILSDQSALENLFNLIDGILNYNGVFIFTCFNGEDILALPPKWDLYENDALKYSIHRLNDKQINVYQHFSKEYYTEYIVNIKKVINFFKKNKYIDVDCKSFSFNFKSYEGESMSDIDRKYDQLYYYVILKKYGEPLVRGAKPGRKRAPIMKTSNLKK
jgi:SAM-dependent methyltransferase